MSTEQKAFQCELIGPAGKLLNCRVTSVVFPAHDGQVGILCDHMPMLSQLGMGVMRVAPLPEGDGKASAAPLEREFLVDGGFALVAENSVTVIAYEAMALPDVKARFAEQGAEPRGWSPERTGEFIKAESERWNKVIKSANVTLE